MRGTWIPRDASAVHSAFLGLSPSPRAFPSRFTARTRLRHFSPFMFACSKPRAPATKHPGLSLVPTPKGAECVVPARTLVTEGEAGWTTQSGRASKAHFHSAGNVHSDLLSSLRLAQAKMKIGFSSSSQPGYRLGNGWRALKFSPARQGNSGLTSDEDITLEGQ